MNDVARDLAVLLVGTAQNPKFMVTVLAAAEQLHTSMSPEAIVGVLGQPPLGDFMEAAMVQLCPGGPEDTPDRQVILTLTALSGVYMNGFVHGVLATTAPPTPQQ